MQTLSLLSHRLIYIGIYNIYSDTVSIIILQVSRLLRMCWGVYVQEMM